MNAKQALFAAVAALAVTSTYAVEATQFVPEASQSQAVRAEVKAEVKRAMADGTLAAQDETYGQVAVQPKSERSRAEVRAEARLAARNHKVDPMYYGG